jgi:hypothetical protein
MFLKSMFHCDGMIRLSMLDGNSTFVTLLFLKCRGGNKLVLRRLSLG